MARLVAVCESVYSYDPSFLPTFFTEYATEYAEHSLNTSKSQNAGPDDIQSNDMSWDTDWGWEDNAQTEKSNSTDLLDWSNQPFVSISPLGDILMISTLSKIACFRKAEENKKIYFELLYEGILELDVNDLGIITSILCIPLASHKKSLQGSAEWTCLIVGHESGHVTFYTETGERVLTQYFHNTPILNFKYNSFKLSRHLNDRDQAEELSILYHDVLVVVEGFSLYQTLKVCRSQLARSGSNVGATQTDNLQLSFKKWALKEQKDFFDQVNVGLSRGNAFDQLVTGSMLGGPFANIRSTPPVHSVYIISGESPFIGFFYASEEEWQPLLSNAHDLAMAVASKVKTALFSAAASWFTGSQTGAEEQKKKVLPSTPLTLRYSLPDKRRQAVVVSICPLGLYCVTVDAFGRVILIDISSGVALRMWKGYRNAEVGWISVKGDKKASSLFLVIYAPKRGLLEVWTACYGPRVAAFNVCKTGKLIYCAHTLMGLNSTNTKYYSGQLSQCYFLDSDGSMKVVEVPYHLAFTDSSSHQTHDFHLIKKFREIVKESSDFDQVIVDRLITCLNQFKLVGFLEQAIDRLINTKLISAQALHSCLGAVADLLTNKTSLVTNLASEKHKLEVFVSCELDLLSIFTALSIFVDSGLLDVDPDVEMEDLDKPGEQLAGDSPTNWQDLIPLTPLLSDNIRNKVSSVFSLFNMKKKAHAVTFKIPFTVSEYLNMFFCVIEKHSGDSDVTPTYYAKIRFRDSVSADEKSLLGEFLFQPYLNGEISLEDFLSLINWDLLASQAMLVDSLVFYWLSSWRYNILVKGWLQRFFRICSECIKLIAVDKLPAFYSTLRSNLRETTESAGALLLSLILLGDLTQCEDKEKKDVVQSECDVWQSMIGKLCDCASLNSILIRNDVTSLVSVRRLEEGSRGLVGELVARCLVAMDYTSEMMESLYLTESDREFSHLHVCFPLSLQYDVLAANCAWEYAVLWTKDTEQVARLAQAVKMLNLLGSGAGCLKQGVSSMLWHVHLSKVLQQLAYLVDKTGKIPPERQVRRETGMTLQAAVQFTEIMAEFLDECFDMSYAEVVPALGIETAWEDSGARLSLCELALDQSAPLPAAVSTHWQLDAALYLFLILKLKISRFLSLFDCKNLFKSLTTSPGTGGADAKLSARSTFLHAAVCAAVSTESSTLELVFKLGKLWLGADVDKLRRSQVYQLYALGRDKDAEHVLPTVSDRALLSVALLPIVGLRVFRLGVAESAPPAVSSWLSSCASSVTEDSALPTLDSTKVLLSHVLNDLKETQSDYKMALQLSNLINE